MVDSHEHAVIEPTPVARRADVLLLQLSEARIAQLLAAEKQGEIDMSGLFHARRGNTYVGAAWGQVVPGRTAFCWPASIVPGEPEETAIELQNVVDNHLDDAQVTLTQAVLPTEDRVATRRLEYAGYKHLTDLDYLMCPSAHFPQELPRSDLEFEPHAPETEERLERLITRTYVATLDCAALEGIRPIKDVLRGYRATGVFREDWWLIAKYDGADVGCLLLADHPELDLCELMYMGIVPEHRGFGWGLALTRHAQWVIRPANRQRLFLAVDRANQPATRLYEAAGFDAWDRRHIYIRTAL